MTDYKLDCIHRGIKKATTAEIQRIIDKELPAYLKNQKACDVKPEHIRDLLRGIYKRNAVRQADCVRSYLMAAYNYGLKAEFDVKRESSTSYRLSFNPVAAIPRIQPIRAGDRNLSQAEIHTLWNALDDAPCNAFSRTVLRLLLVTGQRVQEVTGMRWDELDLNTQLWRLPSNRTKNKQPHTLPLTDLAIELLDPLRQWQGISEFVFPHRTDPSQPMPWRSITWATSQLCKQLDIPSFSPKDLRRTVKSRMADVPISKEIRDRIQNHALHDVSSKHYDRANYLPQMREAMTQWDSWLRGTIAQPYPGSEQPQDSQTRE
jgi:integrase